MGTIFLKLPIVSAKARVQLKSSDVTKLYTSADYEYRYWPLKGNLYSNDLSDSLNANSKSIFAIELNAMRFENSDLGSGLATSFYPDQSKFFMSGVFTVTEFGAGLGMLLGTFNNPSGQSLGFTYYVNSNKNLTLLIGDAGVGAITLANVNSAFYVSAFVDIANKKINYLIVAEGQTKSGTLSATTYTQSGLPIIVGNSMQAQAGAGKYKCYDLVVDNYNRYVDLQSYYNDAKARMNLKGISI